MEPGEPAIVVNRPQTLRGKRRPRGALRQPVVAVRSRFHSVGRSRYALDFGPAIGDNVTLPSRDCMANLVFRGTPIGGPLGWGDANK